MHPWPLTKFWNLNVRGTIHAGAHKGEEAEVYKKYEFEPVIWIEAIPELAEQLRLKVPHSHTVINATLWSLPGESMRFNVANSTGASSVFDLAHHLVEYPNILKEREIIVTTTTIDELNLGDRSNLFVLDLQGAEYQSIQGSVRTLKSLDYVISEVNRKALYRGTRLINDLDKLLDSLGFERVATRWTKHGWGEALFIRRSLLGDGKLFNLRLRAKKTIYWLWLHLFEIPLVHVRVKTRRTT